MTSLIFNYYASSNKTHTYTQTPQTQAHVSKMNWTHNGFQKVIISQRVWDENDLKAGEKILRRLNNAICMKRNGGKIAFLALQPAQLSNMKI